VHENALQRRCVPIERGANVGVEQRDAKLVGGLRTA
jgi:hypothetical protein